MEPSLERRMMEVQRRIASRVVLDDRFSDDLLGGVDQAFPGDLVVSGAVLLDSCLEVISTSCHAMRAAIPYLPGLLSFREGAPAVMAIRALHPRPDIVFVDGCGINHPRMAGLACYIGVLLDLPAIGVSKGVLCGRAEPPQREGDAEPLIHEGRLVGYLLCSRKGCRPIVVAPGHRISADSALELARRTLKGHKLPEPCRLAHEHARRITAAPPEREAFS